VHFALISSPPKGGRDDAVQAYQSQAFEPDRFSVVNDESADDNRDQQNRDQHGRQDECQYRTTENVRQQHENREQAEGDLERAVLDDADRVISLISPC